MFNPDGSAAVRPVVKTAPASALLGSTVSVTADTAKLKFEVVRISATTHTVNNDQRRVPLAVTAGLNNTYRLKVPSDPGVVPPGYYMLFGINAQGTPSVAKIVKLGW